MSLREIRKRWLLAFTGRPRLSETSPKLSMEVCGFIQSIDSCLILTILILDTGQVYGRTMDGIV